MNKIIKFFNDWKWFDFTPVEVMKITKVSDYGLELIKKHEGFRSMPYLDAVKVPTIGYGNTFYPDGTKVTMKDKPISRNEATELLKIIVDKFEIGVLKVVTSNINQNQFDALVSFSYNLGLGSLSKSTLLKKVNINPNDPTIKNEFLKWDKAGGKVLKGLTRRRNEESEHYFS